MNKLEIFNKEIGTELTSLEGVDWPSISTYHRLSEDFIREFKDKLYWPAISACQVLSEDFISEFKDRVSWSAISEYQILSEDFIVKFKDHIIWYIISTHQRLSEDFIRKFKNEINWYNVSSWQKLSEDFIREFKNEVYWSEICIYQKLSENFIREFRNDVVWYNISKNQILSENFIREFKNSLYMYNCLCSNKLSKNAMKELDLDFKIIKKDNWLFHTNEYKKKRIIKCGLYECYDDYFIAYKSIRRDRYSHFNFQYQYLKGGIYESICDYTDDNISFGLSAWTEKEAKNYNNRGIIIKVKIKYKDVGRLVHDSNKIRCRKFEVLD